MGVFGRPPADVRPRRLDVSIAVLVFPRLEEMFCEKNSLDAFYPDPRNAEFSEGSRTGGSGSSTRWIFGPPDQRNPTPPRPQKIPELLVLVLNDLVVVQGRHRAGEDGDGWRPARLIPPRDQLLLHVFCAPPLFGLQACRAGAVAKASPISRKLPGRCRLQLPEGELVPPELHGAALCPGVRRLFAAPRRLRSLHRRGRAWRCFAALRIGRHVGADLVHGRRMMVGVPLHTAPAFPPALGRRRRHSAVIIWIDIMRIDIIWIDITPRRSRNFWSSF